MHEGVDVVAMECDVRGRNYDHSSKVLCSFSVDFEREGQVMRENLIHEVIGMARWTWYFGSRVLEHMYLAMVNGFVYFISLQSI